MSWLAPLWWWRAARGGPTVDELVQRGFVAMDLETTGLDPQRDAVVALAAVPFVAGTPRPGLVTLVNPGRPIPEDATRIHGITDAMVAGAPAIDAVIPRLDAICADHVLVGHGIDFDLEVLRRARRDNGLPKLPNTALDTMRLIAALRPTLEDFSLERAASALEIPLNGRHTAEGDAVIAGRLLLRLLDSARQAGYRTVPELVWLQETSTRLFR